MASRPERVMELFIHLLYFGVVGFLFVVYLSEELSAQATNNEKEENHG
jgi:hypothetical protein